MTERFDATSARAGTIGLPTLVIHGTADLVVPLRFGVEVAACIPAARMITIPGGGHVDLFTRHRALVVDAIVAHARADAVVGEAVPPARARPVPPRQPCAPSRPGGVDGRGRVARRPGFHHTRAS